MQTEYNEATPPLSIHASHEKFGSEVAHHEGFMDVMKQSRSAGNLRANELGAEGMQHSQVKNNLTVAPSETGIFLVNL